MYYIYNCYSLIMHVALNGNIRTDSKYVHTLSFTSHSVCPNWNNGIGIA